jgi:hypothetical protein
MRSAIAACAALLVLFVSACGKPAPTAPTGAFGGATRIERALEGRVYALPTGTPALPNFSALKPIGSVYARELNVPTRDFEEGFPGVTNRYEWFAIDYHGLFSVSQPGRYGFRLSSDDGSRLYVDGALVVDNDGLHPTRSASGQVDLGSGIHAIEVQYFQGPANELALQLWCSDPKGGEAVFPNCGLNLAQRASGLMLLLGILAVLLMGVVVFVILRRRRAAAAG